MKIFDFKIIRVKNISTKKILKDIDFRINKVKGDFRQRESIISWKEALENKYERKFPLIECEICVSSGTYIRSISEMIGKELESCGLAWEIVRLSVGDYVVDDSLE